MTWTKLALADLREVILPPYRIVYEIDDERRSLAILRIWHGARGDFALPL